MALDIIPGYNFGVTERPTQEKFKRQARDLQVSGVGLEHLDADLVAHAFQADSSPSLSAQGWLWTDGAGNTWVETLRGPCRMHRAQGGWESNRYQWRGNPTKPGDPGSFGTASGGETLVGCVGNGDLAGMTAGGIYNGYPEDSAVSGAYTRMCGRGFLDMDTANATDTREQLVALMRTSSSGDTWDAAHDYDSVVPLRKHFAGTLIGDIYGRSMAWVYGCAIYGDGASL